VLDILSCRLDRRCALPPGRTQSVAVAAGRSIRFRTSSSRDALFALGRGWWAMLYAREDGSVVLYRLRGDPKACYDDMKALSGNRCPAVEACAWRAIMLEPLVEMAANPGCRAA
jgi:hypothetical protein